MRAGAYDKKMNAIAGSPNKQGYVEVSGGYYNNAFAGGSIFQMGKYKRIIEKA